MNRTLTIFACVAVCCAMAVSCKNAKTAEPTPEEIQAQKVALADSVLAQIDSFVDEYMLASDNSFRIANYELTEEEKMVKPDYLLDPSFASTLVTKSQKVNALAVYLTDLTVRKIYDMPLDETKEVIAKLAVEINHPIDINVTSDFGIPLSEKIKKEYEACRERGDLAYFWQFQNATVAEVNYVLAKNPELFFRKITDEQWQAYINRLKSRFVAVKKLAEFDPEMSVLYDFIEQFKVWPSDEEKEAVCISCKAAKQFVASNIEKYTTRRNALLQ